MTTGDLKNNIRKLQTELKFVKYEKDVDIENLSKGCAESFLPIYHHTFLEYSRPVVEQITENKIEMFGKTDTRFIGAMYKVLRDLYTYKPPVDKAQFFTTSFAERKIIMCKEIICLVRARHKSLATTRAKSADKRPRGANLSVVNTTGNTSTLPGGKTSRSPTPRACIAKDKHDARGRPDVKLEVQKTTTTKTSVVAKVVNEVRNPTDTKTAGKSTLKTATSTSKPQVMFEMEICSKPSSSPIKSDSASMPPPASYNPCVYSGAAGQKAYSVEVVNMSAGGEYGALADEDDDVAAIPLPPPRPIDMVPITPGRPMMGVAASITSAGAMAESRTESGHENGGDDVMAVCTKIAQSMESLSSRVMGLTERLALVEGQLGGGQIEQTLEGITARLTLVENKIMIMENNTQKVSTSSSRSSPPLMSRGTPTSITTTSRLRSSTTSSPLPTNNTSSTSLKMTTTSTCTARRLSPTAVDKRITVANGSGYGKVSGSGGKGSVSGVFSKVSDNASFGLLDKRVMEAAIRADSIPGSYNPADKADADSMTDALSPIGPSNPIQLTAAIQPQQQQQQYQSAMPALSSAHSSSTPNDPTVDPDSLLASHFQEHSGARDQIVRISQMIHSTQNMINPKVESPIQPALHT